MYSICAVLDVQAFQIKGEFFPREVAIAPIERNIVQSWEIRMPIRFKDLDEKDKELNEFIMNYTGLSFDLEVTDGSKHLGVDKVKLLLAMLHNKYSCECKPNFGIKNHQLGHYLASIGIPFVEIDSPATNILQILYPKKYCGRHELKEDGMCAVNKVYVLKKWLLDEDLSDIDY
jgi:hypothetical protein